MATEEQTTTTTVHVESPLSPRSSEFINNFRNKKKLVSKSSLTREEDLALKSFHTDETLRRNAKIKRFHDEEMMPLAKKAKAATEEDKTDFFVHVWRGLLSNTDKYIAHTTKLTGMLNHKIKTLPKEEQKEYVSTFPGMKNPDVDVLPIKEYRMFMIDGLEGFLRERITENE